MIIKQSVINTLDRAKIDYKSLINRVDKVNAFNRFTGASVSTTPLIAHLIQWVYDTSNQYEMGIQKVNISDFDRIRYFILEQDKDAYYTCID